MIPSISAKSQLTRPFLKWAGGKFRLLHHILPHLPKANLYIEPFIGAGSVFLNTDYPAYVLSDINFDLINLYVQLQKYGTEFIQTSKKYFTPRHNDRNKYYELREKFNQMDCRKSKLRERAALFLYFNRHGYNGLCRFNRKGHFNVPFGRFLKPYFPETEMEFFYKKSQQAEFICENFQETFKRCHNDTVVYCDPPYVPMTPSSNFTQYSSFGFSLDSQETLASLAQCKAKNGTSILISNHDTPYTRDLYKEAKHIFFQARRQISCKKDKRSYAHEILAIY